jgi:amidohydrolase
VVDPIYLTGHVILSLHSIVSRRLNPFDPAVLSIGSICGGQAEDVIPERVEIMATLSYMEPGVLGILHASIERVLSVAQALGGDYEHRSEIGYPPMVNHPYVVDQIRQVGTDLLGAEHLKPPEQHLGGED